MRVISRRTLREFWGKHPQAKTSLEAWYHVVHHAKWKSLVEVRHVYPHADLVGELTVFNIAGNHYRLITDIQYGRQIIYIQAILTHAEYDKGGWKR
jgi:mRNA interferase HigB